ncbi:MAG: D-alanyl-D-alanine carboxypeptidase, partial [Armatimonadetes bacterium]|nr:D-alanyl-D-alanine carboxypeptidase [Armatimonadota bacterium]
LRRRMCGTRAEGHVRAKTGTLTGVSALSGYVDTRGGETIVFSMIMNGFGCDVSRIRRLQDEICVVMAQWSRSEGAL